MRCLLSIQILFVSLLSTGDSASRRSQSGDTGAAQRPLVLGQPDDPVFGSSSRGHYIAGDLHRTLEAAYRAGYRKFETSPQYPGYDDFKAWALSHKADDIRVTTKVVFIDNYQQDNRVGVFNRGQSSGQEQEIEEARNFASAMEGKLDTILIHGALMSGDASNVLLPRSLSQWTDEEFESKMRLFYQRVAKIPEIRRVGITNPLLNLIGQPHQDARVRQENLLKIHKASRFQNTKVIVQDFWFAFAPEITGIVDPQFCQQNVECRGFGHSRGHLHLGIQFSGHQSERDPTVAKYKNLLHLGIVPVDFGRFDYILLMTEYWSEAKEEINRKKLEKDRKILQVHAVMATAVIFALFWRLVIR